MKVRTRKRRRNYKHKAIRRLHGVINAQAVTIGALRAQVGALGGKLLVKDEELESVAIKVGGEFLATNSLLSKMRDRISTLERVPRWLRVFFGAR